MNVPIPSRITACALAVLVAFLPFTRLADAQTGECTGGGCALSGESSHYPASLQSTTSNNFVSVDSHIFAGEWARYSVTAGKTYEWSFCAADGGVASYDSELTLRTDASPGSVICYSDDADGDSGADAKIKWTATFTGVVRVQANKYPCSTNSVNSTLRWRVVPTGTPPAGFTLTNQAPFCNSGSPAIQLTWTASSGAATYTLLRNGSNYASGLTGTSFLNSSNVAASQTYSYQVRAENAYGTTLSNAVSVTVPSGVCGGPPSAPALSNEAPFCNAGSPAIRLNWTASSGATSYTLYRNGSSYATGITGTTFLNSANVIAGQSYTFVIRAVNSFGSSDSNQVTATVPTSVCGNPPPGPLTMANQAPTCSGSTPSVALSWTASAGAQTYRVYRNDAVLSSSLTGLTYTDSYALAPGQTYVYRVRATNSAGNTNSPNLTVVIPANVCSAPPTSPVLTSPPAFCNNGTPAVQLSWTSAAGATSYSVYRNGTLYASGITGVAFLNSANVVAGQTYTYKVRATNSQGTADSNTVSVAVPSSVCGGSTPPGPLTVTAQAPTCSNNTVSIALSWTASSGAQTYRVYRNDTILSSSLTGLTYTDNYALAPGQSYVYRVRATNAAGNTNSPNYTVAVPANVCGSSGGGTPGPFTASSPGPVCASGTPSITLNWTVSAGAQTYRVFRNQSAIGTSLTGQTYTDVGSLSPGQTYTYYVRATNASGNTSTPAITVAVPAAICSGPPTAPQLTGAVPSCSSNQPAVALAWTASAGANYYRVVRNGNLIPTILDEPGYVDSGTLAPGSTYTYKIRAYNGSGATDSTPQSVTIPSTVCNGASFQVSPHNLMLLLTAERSPLSSTMEALEWSPLWAQGASLEWDITPGEEYPTPHDLVYSAPEHARLGGVCEEPVNMGIGFRQVISATPCAIQGHGLDCHYFQCVAFVRAVTPVGATSTWRRGASNIKLSTPPIGTAVATFISATQYGGHTAIFAGKEPNGDVWLWSQNWFCRPLSTVGMTNPPSNPTPAEQVVCDHEGFQFVIKHRISAAAAEKYFPIVH